MAFVEYETPRIYIKIHDQIIKTSVIIIEISLENINTTFEPRTYLVLLLDRSSSDETPAQWAHGRKNFTISFSLIVGSRFTQVGSLMAGKKRAG